jgi:hypothetical protein
MRDEFMKCEWLRENLVLYAYNELADDARFETEQHLARCPECATELRSLGVFHAVFQQLPVQEPTPNLLAASRMRLQESLETAEQGGLWQRLTFDPFVWFRQISFAPALTAVIFIVGFAGGVGMTYRFLRADHFTGTTAAITSPSGMDESSVAGIRSISQQPGSNNVTIQYDSLSPKEAQGSLNDQRIQQLLLFAARNNYNSGVRMDSVSLLTQQPANDHVRETLVYALRYDSNPGVRLKALDGLSNYVKDDVRVRDAVLEALMDDSNQGVRIDALKLLNSVEADSSVRIVLQKLAQSDKNVYIRSQAKAMVAQMPEMN